MVLNAVSLLGQLALLFVLMAALIFWPAGTWHFWQAWLFLGIFFACTIFVVGYFLVRNPAILTRRAQWREPERGQQIGHSLLNLLFFIGLVIPGLDHRYGWSHVPALVVYLGDLAFAVGYLFIFAVLLANPYAGSTVTVEEEQPVISTGPYALVRHPMYLGALPFVYGIPLALGSYWTLLVYLPVIPVIIHRLLHEERLLCRDLPGYAEYTERVRWRLIPGIW